MPKSMQTRERECELNDVILAPLFGKAQSGVVVDRDCTLGLAVSDTQENNLLKFLIIDETKNDIEWSKTDMQQYK